MPPFKGDRYLPVNRISTNIAPPSPLAVDETVKASGLNFRSRPV